MAQDPKPKRRKPAGNKAAINLLFAAGILIPLAVLLLPHLSAPSRAKSLPVTAASTTIDNNLTLRETIGRLNSAQTPGQRINAANWLASQFATNPDIVISSLGQSLSTDSDPVVRATAANSLGQIARQARLKPSGNNAEQESKIAFLLAQQYDLEASDAVRRCIVSAAAELDAPQVDELLKKATADKDPSVKEEAIRAQSERERRVQLKKLG